MISPLLYFYSSIKSALDSDHQICLSLQDYSFLEHETK